MTIFFLNVLLEKGKGSGYDIEHSQTTHGTIEQTTTQQQVHRRWELVNIGGGGQRGQLQYWGWEYCKMYIHASMHTHVCMHVHAAKWLYTHACMHTHTCMHVVMHAYIYTFTS